MTPERPVLGPLAQNWNNPLATNPHVDSLYLLDRPFLRSLRGFRRVTAEFAVVRFLRERHFDTVISTFPEDRFAIYAYVSGAAVRVGQRDQPLRLLFTRAPAVRKDDAGVRTYYLRLVREIGARVTREETEYAVPSDAKRWAGSTLRRAGVRKAERLILIHPGATGAYKIWPPERFAKLAGRLKRLPHTRVAVCFGPEDGPVLDIMRTTLSPRVIEVDTGGHVARLAALMQRCTLCITNDSGPRHLAVAAGTSSLALFRSHHDREWKVYREAITCATMQGKGTCPVCPPDRCLDRIPPHEKFGGYCIRMISVEEVVTKAKEILRAI